MNTIAAMKHGAQGVAGRVLPGFEALADTFGGILAAGLEAGAACAVFKDGVLVADLWGGLRDTARALPWCEDTLVPVYSVTKGVAALAVLHLVDQGLIELDAPVARYWPQFAVHGEQDLTVRAMLGHRAGLPFVVGAVSLEDLAEPVRMADRLAAQAPYFEPGSHHMYHALTIGWLTGELLRRAGGGSMGRYVAALAGRLGVDLHIGLAEKERARLALLEVQTPQQHAMMREFCPPGSVAWQALTLNGTVSLLPGADDGNGVDLNDYRLQALELAGANLITNARSLVALYDSCLAHPGRPPLISKRTLMDACTPISSGAPFDSAVPGATWGAGLMRPFAVQPMLGPASFGHDGYGGSLAFADPDSGIAFAYVRNRLAPGGVKDDTVYRMVDTVRDLV